MKNTISRAAPRRVNGGVIDDYLTGLRRRPKKLPSKLFYDDEGSRLFERIASLDEYYPTRTECSILRDHVDEIADLAGTRPTVVELGSGDASKVHILLEKLDAPAAYIPVDISQEQLSRSCKKLETHFDELRVMPICADYTNGISLPPVPESSGRLLLFFPGSTLGNFEPIEALGFLLKLTRLGGERTNLLIGIDLKKDESLLKAAYDDPGGVTAAFNLNILTRANREFAANFDVDQFKHRADYDSVHGRIVMQLESLCPQTVRLAGETIAFEREERITTEYSYKYRVPEFQALARLAGFTPQAVWTDPDELFSLHYLQVA